MIELLVVLAIIALLVALMIPAIGGVLERGRRTSCIANLKNIMAIMTASAEDNDDYYPTFHHKTHASPYWFDQKKRDDLMLAYGLDRQLCYCPSNQKLWNRDDFWNWKGGTTHSVWGYVYLADDTNWLSRWAVQGVDPAEDVIFARRTSDIPAYKALWVDLNRTLGSHGWYGTARRGMNHTRGRHPAGANTGYMDGHIQWTDWSDMQERLVGTGASIYW